MSAHAEFIAFGRTGGIGCVPMQNLLLLAQLKALGVCPCRIYCFWHFEGIGCVPMQLLAELKALGVLAELKAHAKEFIYCFWHN